MTEDQRGVLRGIAVGAVVTLCAVAFPAVWSGAPQVPDDPAALVRLWLLLSLAAVFWLCVCIIRLARHRFFTPADIHARAAEAGTARARILQSILQNTLEQVVLAVFAQGAWLFTAPAEWRVVAVVCAGLFALGRLLFITRYGHGAPARALGFALTFYPSVALLAGVGVMLVQDLFG